MIDLRMRKKGKAVSDTEVLGEEEVMGMYRHMGLIKILFFVSCAILTVIIAGISMTFGEYDIGFFESYQIVFDHLFGEVDDEIKDFIIFQIRLPSIVAGIIAGAGLAICGAVMQSTMKNPLADPYTTGISSGASFGATLAITLGLAVAAGGYAVVINAFIFALIPMLMIITISSIKRASSTMIILCGIAVMYIFNAMTTVLMLMAKPDDLASVFSWQVGSLAGVKWKNIGVMIIFVIAGFFVLWGLSNKINVLASGDDNANSVGINADRLRLISLLVVSLVAASIVSFTGIIGFIGLVCPHICRIIIGSDNKYLIPASMAVGSALLVFSDLIGRTIIAPQALQVGVITAFIGGPVFLYLLIRERKEVW